MYIHAKTSQTFTETFYSEEKLKSNPNVHQVRIRRVKRSLFAQCRVAQQQSREILVSAMMPMELSSNSSLITSDICRISKFRDDIY